ncbi:MAG: barnase inhibitor [Rhodanobacter denitrificans]|uniref:Barnase inhibitor n=1 Tax=Rhodanobacter denitrificans TaxID=666685 RepID=A0A2W5KTN3_9GAMM|nr:MAG: barnase inhibitor [Rhodanobacter denitrificans]
MSTTRENLDDLARAGLHLITEDEVEALIRAARAAAFEVRRIDLRGCVGKAAWLERIAGVMDFPETFGHNWDALEDSLRDLSWLPASGYAVFVRGDAPRRVGRIWDTLLDVLESAAMDWTSRGVPFWVFVTVPPDDGEGVRPVRETPRRP